MTYSGQAMIHVISKAKHEPCYKQAEMHIENLFYICQNKQANQLCFMDSTIPLLLKLGTSSFLSYFQQLHSSFYVGPGWETPKKDVFS